MDVKSIMDTWTTQMGYPVITVKRNGRSIEATQKHFIVDHDYDKSKVKE